MVVSTAVHVRQSAVFQYDLHASAAGRSRSPSAPVDPQEMATATAYLPMIAQTVPVAALRAGVGAFPVVSLDRGVERVVGAALRPGKVYGKAYGTRTERWNEGPSGIRDRVSISSEAYARMGPRRSTTYDRNGNLPSIDQPSGSTEAGAYAETIRDQVTLVGKPPGETGRGSTSPEPVQLDVWFSASPILVPA